jgi:serine/threonine-protein kinase
MGTAEYMPPEQLYAASDVDQRADLYALGVMLFEMLSGKRPAEGGDAEVIVGKVLSGQVFALETLEPNLPAGLVSIVRRAIAPDRDARFASAREFRAALEPFAGHGVERTSTVPRTLADEAPTAADARGSAFSSRGSTEPAAAPIVPQPGWGTSQGPPGRIVVHRRRRPLGLILALSLTLLAAAGVVVVLLAPQAHKEPEPTPPPNLPADPGETTITPLDQAPQHPVPTPPATQPTGTPATPPPRPALDAGAPATLDAGAPLPAVPPFQLPSTFPPITLPSGFPTTLPSVLPPLPSSFPGIPGLGPPPQSSPRTNDAGP